MIKKPILDNPFPLYLPYNLLEELVSLEERRFKLLVAQRAKSN